MLALIVDSFLVSSHLFTFCRRSTTVSYPKGKQHRARMPVHVTERKTVEISPPEDVLVGIVVCNQMAVAKWLRISLVE